MFQNDQAMREGLKALLDGAISVEIVKKDETRAEGHVRTYLCQKERDALIASLVAASPEVVDVLCWLDRKGGLGLDVHQRIKDALTLVQRRSDEAVR